MSKVRSRAGHTLADVYDVPGSSISIDELEDRQIVLSHDMASTIFSERFEGNIRRVESNAVAQDGAFGTLLNLNFRPTHHRVLGVMVLVDTASRILNCAVHLVDNETSREFPIWVFDGTNTDLIRMQDEAGAAVENVLRPIPAYSLVPNMKIGNASPDLPTSRWTYAMRGTASSFGAGTVTLTLRVFHAFAIQAGGLRSRGLPIPSW